MLRHFCCLALLAVAATALSAAEDEGFKDLFDGKTLTGWAPVGGAADNWKAADGRIVTEGKGGGWLSTDREYTDFVLRLEYRTRAGGNSGVFIRAPRSGDPAYTGMEIQVLDDEDPRYRDIKPAQHCGSVYGVEAAKPGHTKPAGDWNTMEITAKGPKITVKLNDTVVTEADLDAHKDAAKEHPGILRKGGYIGLQSHSEPLEFRNIRIKEL